MKMKGLEAELSFLGVQWDTTEEGCFCYSKHILLSDERRSPQGKGDE